MSNRRLRRLIQLELGLELADNATGGSYNSDVMFLDLVRAPGILIYYSGNQPNHRDSAPHFEGSLALLLVAMGGLL